MSTTAPERVSFIEAQSAEDPLIKGVPEDKELPFRRKEVALLHSNVYIIMTEGFLKGSSQVCPIFYILQAITERGKEIILCSLGFLIYMLPI